MVSDEWRDAHRARLVLVRGVLLIHEDPQRFLDMVRAADNHRDAVEQVSAAYGVDRTIAMAMVDTQFGKLTREGHRRLAEELASLEHLAPDGEGNAK